MAGKGELIDCNDLAEYPIEHAIKCIHIMQSISEFDDITELMKQRLMELYENVPIKNGKKSYANYDYMPSGICEYKWGVCQIVLAPYLTQEEIDLMSGKVEDKKEDQKEEKKFYQPYTLLRHHCTPWFLQLKDHIKRQFGSDGPSISFVDALKMYETYKGLSDEEKKVAGVDLFNKLDRALNYFNSWFTWEGSRNNTIWVGEGHNRRRIDRRNEDQKLWLLDVEGLKKIEQLYSAFTTKDDWLSWNDRKNIEEFLEKDLNIYLVDTGITINDFCVNRPTRWRDENLEWDFEQFVNVGYPKILALLEEEPQFRSFFERVKLIPKTKKSKATKKSKTTEVEEKTA
jgi:hypothetical protein